MKKKSLKVQFDLIFFYMLLQGITLSNELVTTVVISHLFYYAKKTFSKDVTVLREIL